MVLTQSSCRKILFTRGNNISILLWRGKFLEDKTLGITVFSSPQCLEITLQYFVPFLLEPPSSRSSNQFEWSMLLHGAINIHLQYMKYVHKLYMSINMSINFLFSFVFMLRDIYQKLGVWTIKIIFKLLFHGQGLSPTEKNALYRVPEESQSHYLWNILLVQVWSLLQALQTWFFYHQQYKIQSTWSQWSWLEKITRCISLLLSHVFSLLH